MLSISQAAADAMEATVVQAAPDAVLEFNYNLIDNTYIEAPGPDSELFPKESVLWQRYVDSGLPRAIVGESRVSSPEDSVHYRVVSEDDTYKYWISPTDSTQFSISDAVMTVWYHNTRPMNKVRVVFDVSFAAPASVFIEVRRNNTWVTAATSAVPNSDGVIELYAQANESWSTNYNIDHPQQISGISVSVNSMSQAGVRAHFVSISGRYRVDVSDRITNINITKSLENVSPLTPLGDTSVNSMDLSMEDVDGDFNPENTESEFYDSMTRNVMVEPYVTISGHNPIPQGKYFVESWGTSAPSAETSLSCSDFSRFMQETYIKPFILQDHTLSQAVRELLQRAGFNIDVFILSKDPVIPYLWYDEDVSLWEALKDLANATLAYFFVDDFGEFYWVDLDSVRERSSVYTIDADRDIVDLDHEFDVIANRINLEYNVYGAPRDEWTGEVITQELWSPGEDVALLSMPLASSINSTQDTITINTDTDGFRLWPEDGYINIQGERMRYSGKDYDLKQLTGVERGVLGTTARSHATGTTGSISTIGTRTGRLVLRPEGNLRIVGPSGAISTDYNMSLFGNNNTQHAVYGTRIMFPAETTYETGGLVIHRRGSHGGTFIEITTSRIAARNNRDEIRVYRVAPAGGNTTIYEAGIPYSIALNNWYDIEVVVEYTGPGVSHSVFVNGMFVTSFVEERTSQGRFGPYVRGRTIADFYNIYYSTSAGASVYPSQDVASGSNWSSWYVIESGDRFVVNNEFTPFVKQIQEFNVDYSKYPATGASVLNTNRWQVFTINHTPGPFGSHFFLENKSKSLAVVNGDSPNLFQESVRMHLMIYGDPVIVDREENIDVIDKDSVRRHGAVDLTISNPWIQTDEMAKAITGSVRDHFADVTDNITANIFPVYPLELGDVVAVDYEEYGYKPDSHKYYILGSSLSWNDGFTQSLTLRRQR